LSDWAAALTYYGLLALFPALIALVGLIGLVGDPASTTKTITQIGPGWRRRPSRDRSIRGGLSQARIVVGDICLAFDGCLLHLGETARQMSQNVFCDSPNWADSRTWRNKTKRLDPRSSEPSYATRLLVAFCLKGPPSGVPRPR